jgi:hypothetical protein
VYPVLYEKDITSSYILYPSNSIICKEGEKSSLLTYLDLFQNNHELYDIKDENGNKTGEEGEKWGFVVQAYISDLSVLSQMKEWGVKLTLEEWDPGDSQHLGKWVKSLDENDKEIKDRKYRVKKKINKKSVAIKFSINAYAGIEYRVFAHLYSIDKNGYEDVITAPNYKDPDEEDVFGNSVAGLLNLTADFLDTEEDHSIGSDNQVIDMGDL